LAEHVGQVANLRRTGSPPTGFLRVAASKKHNFPPIVQLVLVIASIAR
jgi:hypothetical protein